MDRVLIKKLTDFFESKPGIILALVYGSYARGSQTKKSDVDVAVAMEKALSLDMQLSLQSELSMLLEKEIDLVDIRKIKGLIHYKIFSEGFCIKKSGKRGKALLHKHIVTALYWYEDFYPLYSRSQNIILKKTFNLF